SGDRVIGRSGDLEAEAVWSCSYFQDFAPNGFRFEAGFRITRSPDHPITRSSSGFFSHPQRNFGIYLAMNGIKTLVLLTSMTVLLVLVGDWIGGRDGMIYALVIAGVMNFVSYFFSDRIALAMYRAQPVTREQLPRVYDIVERLAQVMH